MSQSLCVSLSAGKRSSTKSGVCLTLGWPWVSLRECRCGVSHAHLLPGSPLSRTQLFSCCRWRPSRGGRQQQTDTCKKSGVWGGGRRVCVWLEIITQCHPCQRWEHPQHKLSDNLHTHTLAPPTSNTRHRIWRDLHTPLSKIHADWRCKQRWLFSRWTMNGSHTHTHCLCHAYVSPLTKSTCPCVLHYLQIWQSHLGYFEDTVINDIELKQLISYWLWQPGYRVLQIFD